MVALNKLSHVSTFVTNPPNLTDNHCYLSCQFVTRVRLDGVPLSEVEEPWERGCSEKSFSKPFGMKNKLLIFNNLALLAVFLDYF